MAVPLSLTDSGEYILQAWWMHFTLALALDHGCGEEGSGARMPAAPAEQSEVATVQPAPRALLPAGPRWGQAVEGIAANVAGMIAHHVSAIWAIDNTGSRLVPN